jgi:hypothetical protein
MKKISIFIVLLASLLFSTVSCDDYLDCNSNVDAPDYVDAYLYLAGIEEAYNEIYYDIRALGPLTQMMGTSSSSFGRFASHYYYAGSDIGGQMWRMVYWSQGENLENLIDQSVEAENWTLAGIGYAMKAYSWDLLTKYHGELILNDAFVSGLLSHDYDYQEDIYPAIRGWAYKAIEYLEMDDATEYGTTISDNDYIYGGDKDKWIKFAYAVLVKNFASLSNKTDFVSTYADSLIYCAENSFQSSDDDATVTVEGGGSEAAYTKYNNFWGTYRGNLSRTYFQHEYAVQVFTGTVPKYDEETGLKTAVDGNEYVPYELADEQIICDTNVYETGHYDPRVAVKLATTDDPTYDYIDNADSIKARHYYGGTKSSTSGPIGTAPSFYGREYSSSTTTDGSGRWIYRDDAPYILTTCAEIKFCLAEAYYKKGDKASALTAFQEGVAADMDFTATYIDAGSSGSATGGDKITTSVFNSMAAEYEAGPFVGELSSSDLTLSHIMMQKWVALYPWGALEAWVDERKYQYDIDYSGDYPTNGDGWTDEEVTMKWDTDDSKVYKGFYLYPAQVQSRKTTYYDENEGSPCYRVRPRYNSEYMWNYNSLSVLLPISGTADNYQCSMPWFAYPGDQPTE